MCETFVWGNKEEKEEEGKFKVCFLTTNYKITHDSIVEVIDLIGWQETGIESSQLSNVSCPEDQTEKCPDVNHDLY